MVRVEGLSREKVTGFARLQSTKSVESHCEETPLSRFWDRWDGHRTPRSVSLHP